MMKEAMEEPAPPVFVVLSGYDDFELVRSAMRLGAIDYLMKLSLEEGELRRVIREARKCTMKKQPDPPDNGNASYDFKENFIKELLCILVNICKEQIPGEIELFEYQLEEPLVTLYLESRGDLSREMRAEVGKAIISCISHMHFRRRAEAWRFA